jgi:hypothetical protein
MYTQFNQDDATTAISLTHGMQTQAQWFAQHHPDPAKGRQVYLNTIAISVTANILNLLGIANHPDRSDSWNPAMQFASDARDLVVDGIGRLDCCPVVAAGDLPDAIAIPPEAQRDRMGYVVVKIDVAAAEATLLGFVPHLIQNPLPLSALQPVPMLIAHLTRLEAQAQSQVNLGAWVQGQITAGWEAVTAVVTQLQGPQLAWRLEEDMVRRAKPIEFASGLRIALVAGIRPLTEQRKDITVEIYPLGVDLYLPPQLQFTLLDAEGNPLMEAQARTENQNIQFEFRGEVGDRFWVQIEFDTFFHQEKFSI